MITTFVYVMAVRHGQEISAPVKVGISSKPKARLLIFQTSCPSELVLVRTFRFPDRPIAAWLEACFHDTQKKHRLRGEWFNLQPHDACDIVGVHTHWALCLFCPEFTKEERNACLKMAGVI
jgi:hypothetical protein